MSTFSVCCRWLPVMMAGLLVAAGCTKKSQHEAAPTRDNSTLMSYLSGGNNITLYYAAFQRANMANDTAYQNDGPYTFFIPTDSAMQAAGITADSVGRMDTTTLYHLVRYAIVKGRISPATMLGNYKLQVTTLDTLKPILVQNYYGMFYNGISLATADVELADGVINTIGQVATVPTQSVQQIIQTRPELSILNAVLNMLVQNGDPYMQAMLQEGGKTVFAPTNAAFASFGIPTPDSAIQYQYANQGSGYSFLWDVAGMCFTGIGSYIFEPNLPTTYLTYTVSTAEFLGGYPIGNSTLKTYGGSSYNIMADGLMLQTPDNLVYPKIIVPDIWATDGIIHEVDQMPY